MKKLYKVAVIIIITGVISAIAIGIYVFRKAPISIENQNPDFILTCEQLVSELENDEEIANQKYLDKILEVRGKIADISADTSGINLILCDDDSFQGVSCRIVNKTDELIEKLVVGDSVIVKGICTGYLMDVVLNKGVIVKKL